AGALAFKISMQHSFDFELRALHMCFVVLIMYAIITYIAAKFLIDYQHYNFVASGIRLKATLIDRAILFLVFFYALRDSRNAYSILKVLLLAVALAHTIALLNGLGLMQTGQMGENENERVQGLMGEPNQDAAFGALFLPALGVAMFMSKGLRRIPWVIGLLATLAAIAMTASRGGFVAMVLSGIWGAVLLRRYIPLQRLMAIGVGAVGISALAIAAVIPFYGDLLYRRVIGESSVGDVAVASSGRTEIWSTAVATMADTPITLFTGFGWNVYFVMPFRYAPHNYYLDLWFNLGLAGLISGTLMLVIATRESLKAVPYAQPVYQPQLMAFAVGTIAVAIATFFVDLYTPWLWFWAYAGLILRIAVNAKRESNANQSSPAKPKRADPYGWMGQQNVGGGALT
ncbi:MAG TPA: O-antigen ligase family protein, partial [Steroidobacteraceae bacterium]|nr:O-antigen ligase family protein [Steroidobacteraceae bacterium]